MDPTSEESYDEHERLRQLRALNLLDTPPEPLFDGLVRTLSLACDVPIALVTLVDEHRQWFKARVGWPGVTQTPRDQAFCAFTIQSDDILEVQDACEDSRFCANPLVVDEPGIRFYAGAALTLPGGARVGTLCVIDRVPRRLDERQRAILVELASVASQALLLRDAGTMSRAELALMDSERRFRELSDSSPFGIFRTDAAGLCSYTNPRWQAIFGMNLKESLGTGWARGVHPEDRERVRAQWTANTLAGLDTDIKFRVLHPDGDVRYIRSRAGAIRALDGTVNGYVGALEDISDRLRAEQRLRDSEALLERSGRLAGVGGWRVDLADNAVHWTSQTCRIHDRPPGHQPSLDEAIGYYDGPAQAEIARAVEQAIRTGRPYDLELPLLTATGRPIWVRTVGEVEYEGERPVQLIGAFQDVTARRLMEHQLSLANMQLRHLYERTPALLLSVDSLGTVRAVSDQLLHRTSFEREQVVGKPLSALLGNEIARAGVIESLFERGFCERVPYRLRCRNGKELEILLSATVEPGSSQSAARALAALEDVTEANTRTRELHHEHQMRVQTERHARELQILLDERSDMLDVLAHEVRQPLNNASAALQSADAVLAQRGEVGAVDQLRRAQRVLQAVLAGVDNTLAASSLLAGAAEIELGDVDVDMLLGIVVGDMPVLERPRVRIVRESSVRTIWVDAGLMRLALRNLLANALAYSPPGSEVLLRLGDTEVPAALNIDVIDQGSGIGAELQTRLFQRGARGAGKSPSASHGLGLYIARRAMEIQGGRIELLGTGSQGTVMRLQIRDT